MEYRPRPGVVSTKISGMHVLIPSRKAYAHCRSIRRLPMLWALTWELLERENAEEKIMQLHRLLTKKSDGEIENNLRAFYAKMYEDGYLIRTDDEEVKA